MLVVGVLSLGWEDPRRRKWKLIPVFLFGKSQGWCGLAGYSPWGLKELDVTEQLTNNKNNGTGEGKILAWATCIQQTLLLSVDSELGQVSSYFSSGLAWASGGFPLWGGLMEQVGQALWFHRPLALATVTVFFSILGLQGLTSPARWVEEAMVWESGCTNPVDGAGSGWMENFHQLLGCWDTLSWFWLFFFAPTLWERYRETEVDWGTERGTVLEKFRGAKRNKTCETQRRCKMRDRHQRDQKDTEGNRTIQRGRTKVVVWTVGGRCFILLELPDSAGRSLGFLVPHFHHVEEAGCGTCWRGRSFSPLCCYEEGIYPKHTFGLSLPLTHSVPRSWMEPWDW